MYVYSDWKLYRVEADRSVTRVAGNGNRTNAIDADGRLATELGFNFRGYDVDRDGTLYIAEDDAWDGRRILIHKVDPNGIVTTLYDSGRQPNLGNHLWDLAVGPDGSLYYGGGVSYSVTKITPDGRHVRVAGGNGFGRAGDGGLATDASL